MTPNLPKESKILSVNRTLFYLPKFPFETNDAGRVLSNLITETSSFGEEINGLRGEIDNTTNQNILMFEIIDVYLMRIRKCSLSSELTVPTTELFKIFNESLHDGVLHSRLVDIFTDQGWCFPGFISPPDRNIIIKKLTLLKHQYQ
ncbi:Hypothetical protein HVR_LOCUS928 [uncultured virus]|nr:Hypothetical protein HVR_LOCUS928 [uncultured virus]